jgi:hypothetical protein
MEASKIKVGDRLAFTRTPRPSRYETRLQVQVIQAIPETVNNAGSKYRQEIQLRDAHGAERAWTYAGKAHFIVAPIDNHQDVRDVRWIVSSQHLPETWSAYEERTGQATQAEEARQAAAQVDNERQQALIENLAALGIEADTRGRLEIVLDLNNAETLLSAVLDAVQ